MWIPQNHESKKTHMENTKKTIKKDRIQQKQNRKE